MSQKMTQSELENWYKSYWINEAKKNGLTNPPDQHGEQSFLRHDLWSLYDFGDIIKVVYFKSLPKKPDPKNDPLYAEDRPAKPRFEKCNRGEDERFRSSISRAKSRVFELAMCNEFTHFCTFTQDKTKRDRFDLTSFREDFAMLVRNLNRARDSERKIKYLIIPEKHKNGAWHMHGLLSGLTDNDLRAFELAEKLPKRIKDQIKAGAKVYDWTRYRRAFGYFTCTEIKSGVACSKYITKYISKDFQSSVRDAGEHLFFASQGLKGRETVVKLSNDVCPVTEWDFENQYIKVAEIPKSQ